jgi:hypothetical protein
MLISAPSYIEVSYPELHESEEFWVRDGLYWCLSYYLVLQNVTLNQR